MGSTAPVSDLCHPENVDDCLGVPGEVGLVVELPGVLVLGAESGGVRVTRSPAQVEHWVRVEFDPCQNRCPHCLGM